MIRRPPRSTLFPYTTLFRSHQPSARILVLTSFEADDKIFPAIRAGALGYTLKDFGPAELVRAIERVHQGESSLHPRSEEHTSELQSRQYLVCRLLLEKKKHI